MTAEEPAAPDQSPDPSYTLHPIVEQGPDALTSDEGTLDNLKLVKVKYLENPLFHQTATREADDLFAAAAADPDHPKPIPQDATLTAATIAFHRSGSPDTHIFEIRPPNTVTAQCTADLPAILRWLAKSAFAVSRRLARTALTILIAAAAAIIPATDDCINDDDEDTDSERTHQSLPAT